MNPSIKGFLRGRQQEMAIAVDDLTYAMVNRRIIRGDGVGLEDLPATAEERWRGKPGDDFHVVYVGHPTNWEPHNIPAEPGLAKTVTTVWLRDLGFGTYTKEGILRHRERVGAAVADAVKAIDKDRPVHLLLTYLSGAQVLADAVAEWRRLGVMTASFHFDDRLGFRSGRVGGQWRGPAATATAYDLNLTNVRRSLPKYGALGARAMFWPEGANPAVFSPLGIPRTHDVAFLGASYGPRQATIRWLERQGFSVLARGPGWPGGEIPQEEVPAVLNSGRVVLGFSGIGWSMRATCLKGRDFEAPMCGAAYLPSFNPELQYVYEVGKEVVAWRDRRDLSAKISALLGDVDGLERLRAAGLARARRDHSWTSRIAAIAGILRGSASC